MKKRKEIHGRAIYMPQGKAGEFSSFATNLYCGCTHRCTYCYNRSGRTATTLGSDTVTLKKSLANDEVAFETFKKELLTYKEDIIREGGLHFTFVSDPCLKETINLTWRCIDFAQQNGVLCKVLTKAAWWLDEPVVQTPLCRTNLIQIGFTLTGHDECEPGASTNKERIAAIKELSSRGVETFCSIEPIISTDASLEMIKAAMPYTKHFKIGIISGKKDYTPEQIRELKHQVDMLGLNAYWKKSLIKFIQ